MTRLRGELLGRPLSGREQEVLVAIVNEAPERRGGRSSRECQCDGVLGRAGTELQDRALDVLPGGVDRHPESAGGGDGPQLGHRYLETPDRRRMAALAHDILQRRIAA